MSFDFNRQMCVLSFDRNTYDLIFSDAATFAFLKSRFYYRLDSMLLEDSKKTIKQYIDSNRYFEPFIVYVDDANGNYVEMACRLEPTDIPDGIKIRMIRRDVFADVCAEFALEKEMNDALAALSEDVYYVYDRAADTIECHSNGADRQALCSLSLTEFEDKLCEKADESSRDKISKFVANIRMGTRSFADTAECRSDGSPLNLTGVSVYHNGAHVRTMGKLGGKGCHAETLNLYDQLTGTFLKGRITDYASHRINDLHERTAIAIIDLDDFKQVNDNYGHAKGDEVLRKISDIITRSCGNMGKVGRIGGDEFFVVYDNFEDIQQIRYTLMGMRSLAAMAYSEQECGFTTTLSVGCSVYPDDYNGSFEEMFRLADAFLYRAKDKGKDRYIVYNREKHGEAEDILKYGFKKSGLDKSELVCKLTNAQITGQRLEIEEVLEEISRYFVVERIVLYNKTDRCLKAQCGQKHLSLEKIRKTIGYLYEDGFISEYVNGSMLVNNIDHFRQRAPEAYRMLTEQSTFALQQYIVNGKSGKQYVLSLDAVNARCTWNIGDAQYYRIIVKILEKIL